MRPILIALILLTATTTFAQTDKTQEDKARAGLKAQEDKMRLQQELHGCPVGFTAQHQGSPAAIWTTSLEDANKSAAELKKLHSGVHVDLHAPHKEIKQAELAVFFLPPGTRALPVTGSQFAASPEPASEMHKNFSLVSGKDPSHQLDGDLLLGPVASITHIKLLHVIYSDGTEWKAHNSDTCSIKPSLYMPVDAK
jgi:hypothetical protein